MRRDQMIQREALAGYNRLTWGTAELVGLTDDEAERVVKEIQDGRFIPEEWEGRYQSGEFVPR